jgi:hypothetical protein
MRMPALVRRFSIFDFAQEPGCFSRSVIETGFICIRSMVCENRQGKSLELRAMGDDNSQS